MRVAKTTFVSVCLGFALMLAPRAARSQAAQASQAGRPAPDAEAVTFFDEGRRLMGESKYREAIPKFEESLRHARTVGALLNLGRCYEEAGRMASAWATFRAAGALARELHDAREEAANRFASAARPKVSTLVLDTRAIDGISGAQVKRDGVVLGPAARAEAAPVDPGEHVVEVTAPGKITWIGRTDVAPGGARTLLRVAALEDAPTPAGEAVAESSSQGSASSSQRTLGFVALGTGGVGLALGAASGLFALSKHHEAVAACPTYPDHCDSSGSADAPNRASQTWATVSTVAFLAGGVAIATGLTLVLTAPRAHVTTGVRVRVLPLVAASSAGVGAFASW
jgi:tetratricopeptide (TPR) repeat protein